MHAFNRKHQKHNLLIVSFRNLKCTPDIYIHKRQEKRNEQQWRIKSHFESKNSLENYQLITKFPFRRIG